MLRFVCWISIFFMAISAKRYMKMFADAGIGIHCPSRNKVYIHPITGDLQLCKQQLGVYNETSCPGGTACERFPILIPGFQDYCCWSEINPETVSSSTESSELPPMSKRKSTVTVMPIDEIDGEKIFPIDEDEDEMDGNKNKRKSNEEEEEEEEEIEWEFETTTMKPKKTKSRKIAVQTTTEPPITTTIRTSSSRLPQCENPQDTVLIDYGNRLRDCYFQPCLRGFKCQFNREIRRFICCGNGVDVPPAGLPMIPAPKPLLPPRPFRPNGRPFGMLNDGDEEPDDKNNVVFSKKRGKNDGCKCDNFDCNCERNNNRKINGSNRKSGSGNQNNQGGKQSKNNGRNGNEQTNDNNFMNGPDCEMNCRNNGGMNSDCELGCSRRNSNNWNSNSEECNGPFCNNNNNKRNNENGNRNRPQIEEFGCEAEHNNNGPLPQIPEPKPLCKGYKIKKSGSSKNSNGPNQKRGPPEPRRLRPQPPPTNRNSGPFESTNFSNNMNSNKNRKNNSKGNMNFSSRKQSSSSSQDENRFIPRETRSNNNFLNNMSFDADFCPEGSEYFDGTTSPKCIPPAIDSCPMNHRCLPSKRYNKHVCCKIR